MRFRPCIDIHNGQVKQIVGGSLTDVGDSAKENFVSQIGAADYAKRYAADGLTGGHVILLNGKDSPYYEQTKQEALSALRAYPGGLQVGGGITAENASEFLDAGASHVIVTSYVFRDGMLSYDRLNRLCEAVGKEHIVLDLSCRKKDDAYYIVTDRWQRFTQMTVDEQLLRHLEEYCDEFLIHAVDVEGKASGIEGELIKILSTYDGVPLTYAGGIHSYDAIREVERLGGGKIDYTIGSALDLFGGHLSYERLVKGN